MCKEVMCRLFQCIVFHTCLQLIENLKLPCRFHVDKMSSAHVYLRLHKGQTFDDIPEGVLEDCAQLVKANSIQGKFLFSCSVLFRRETLFV